MNRNVIVLSALAAALAFTPGLHAADPAAQAPKHVMSAEDTITAKATVESIDQKTREVTLKDEQGRLLDIVADQHVKNLAQVKVGDVVEIVYKEAIAIHILPGANATGAAVADAGGTAKPGEKPAAAAGRHVTIVAVIEAIDEATQHVTLRGPQGRLVQVRARNPENLKKVKVGDSVQIDYTRAMAVAVRKPNS
jgi:Cu/Ag efflux protein CusF